MLFFLYTVYPDSGLGDITTNKKEIKIMNDNYNDILTALKKHTEDINSMMSDLHETNSMAARRQDAIGRALALLINDAAIDTAKGRDKLHNILNIL